MIKNYFVVWVVLGAINLSVANADDDGIQFSFAKPDAYQSVNQSIDLMSTWAEGEYAEHEGEGLFSTYPNDAAVISETLSLVAELKALASKARADGDEKRASAYLFSAEATARYAAKMPHLLEDRVESQH